MKKLVLTLDEAREWGVFGALKTELNTAIRQHTQYSIQAAGHANNRLGGFLGVRRDRVYVAYLFLNQRWRMNGGIPGYGPASQSACLDLLENLYLADIDGLAPELVDALDIPPLPD